MQQAKNTNKLPVDLDPRFRSPTHLLPTLHKAASTGTWLLQPSPFDFCPISVATQVYADTSGGGTVAPYLYLGGIRGADGSSGLPAVPSLVVDAASPSVSDEIVFVYTVEDGDSTTSAVLEVDGTSAIRDGDAPLVDLLERAVDVTLPVMGTDGSLSATSTLSIDASQPVVVAVGSSLDGGEYGVGQVRLPGLAAERMLECSVSRLNLSKATVTCSAENSTD